MTAFSLVTRGITPQHLFMGSALIVNGGNYVYNLALGRILGPEAFADVALMITLLLVLSFVGMTFQMAVAKFTAQLDHAQTDALRDTMNTYAFLTGIILGTAIILTAPALQQLWHTESAWMFRVFGFGIPVYFLMSVNRGQLQGNQKFGALSFSYQSEMWGRLLITLLALLLIPRSQGILVAFGILISLGLGLFPLRNLSFEKRFWSSKVLPVPRIRQFILITAFYELTQILINNSDILIVRHFFDAQDAGLYASLALIGRVVYFMAWMFVMLLLPAVVKTKKEGKKTAPLLLTYIGYIMLLSFSIVFVCAFFPETIIQLLFGDAYRSIAGLLWPYALATSLFAIANIFTYYYLALDHYKPIAFAAFFGVLQVVLLSFFHNNLATVVWIQVGLMLVFLVVQFMYFIRYRAVV